MDYDADPIQVFTQYSYEQMKAFQRFHFRKARRNTILLLCLLAPMLICNVFIYCLYNGLGTALMAFLPMITLCVLLLVLPFVILNGAFYTQKAHSNATKLMQNGQYYSFCNNDLAYHSEQGDSVSQGRTAYSVILTVWETKDIFYLYTSKNQAILVDKAGFITGNPDELRALLQSRMPANKYKTYKL